ncbi:hypothetical protein K2173_022838 [Erythroxylum novogranatense]|uniref:RING-type E3 ubiquitin transferase n=1 Tax=Erythroxylum novogranatense TaxID=1862640 RepID=A0AAV8SMV9_9ROSI|nr:hypothetical protein K2173_022838 [Erythroxylum novogranatense]
MAKNGKHKWKIFSRRRSPKPTHPPKEFLCPISGSLMSDPVVVSSGQTFERVSVQVSRDLGFIPVLDDGTTPDFTTVIPNLVIKSTILSWCKASGAEEPRAPDYAAVETTVRTKMRESNLWISNQSPTLRVSEVELLQGVVESPPVIFSHAVTEIAHRPHHCYSSSSEESVIVNTESSPFTPLPLETRPACYTSSSNSSSEITQTETLAQSQTFASEEEEITTKLISTEVHEQEQGAISLRKLTKTREESRGSLCSRRLLEALRPLITSHYVVVQTNAVASLVNLSLEKANKLKIVRLGFVPPLIEVLKAGNDESQGHAAGALFSLASEDENKMAIGVLGALQPLMHSLRSENERTRHDSALALYHVSLMRTNRAKLVKLGAVPTLLGMVESRRSVSPVLLILCNLAACDEGRSVMLDANAVAILVEMLREEATRENCVAALWALSRGSLRFTGLAKEARAAEVLRTVEERGNERARQKAKKMLQMLRGKDEEEEEEVDWEGLLGSDGFHRTRHLRNGHGRNSSNF